MELKPLHCLIALLDHAMNMFGRQCHVMKLMEGMLEDWTTRA
jgi:hypothetical protein